MPSVANLPATDEMLAVLHEADRRLAARGQRLTPLRRRLIESFAAAERPLSVQNLLDGGEGGTSRLPASSVYRNLQELCDCGVVHRLNFDEGFIRYELDHSLTAHHHHLICGRCQSVLDVDSALLDPVEDALGSALPEIERRTGFAVLTHQVDLVGICSRCANHH